MASTVRTDKVGPVSGSADFILPTADGTVGQFLKTDGSLALGFATVAVTGFSDIQFLTASQTYTVPTGITKIVIDLVSGGGGGGGGDGPTYSSGGSAGSNAIKSLVVSVGQTYTLVVGAAGAGGTGGASGGDGGTSSFVNLSGTTVNLQCTGGGAGHYNAYADAGGVATGGGLNIDGSTSSGPSAGQANMAMAGPTRWGFPSGWGSNGTTAAQDGVGYGAGGCPAYATTNAIGAAGRPGLCVITEYK